MNTRDKKSLHEENLSRLEVLLSEFASNYGVRPLDFDTLNGKLYVEIPKNRCDNPEDVAKQLEVRLNGLIKLYRESSDKTKFSIEYSIVEV